VRWASKQQHADQSLWNQMSIKHPMIVLAVTLALLSAAVGVSAADQHTAVRTRSAATLVSVRLAALGAGTTSPRGPYRARPVKIAFNYGSYYGAGTKALWIDQLRWFDWGKPVAYASGLVHARVWPSKKFITTAGGITLDQLRSCGMKRSYYTYASMLVPAGFPQNTQSTAYGISEQALTPC
jgi:hypothetical protein